MQRRMQTELSFGEAEERLKPFLAQQDYPANVLWVFREDLLSVGRKTFLRWPLPAANRVLAEQHFEAGKVKGLGVKLGAYCRVKESSCCYVLVPDDEDHAEGLMMTELRFTCPTEKRPTIKIRTTLLWQIASACFPSPQCHFINDVPKRSANKL